MNLSVKKILKNESKSKAAKKKTKKKKMQELCFLV